MRMSKYLQQEPEGSEYISLGPKHPGCTDFLCTPDCFSLIYLLWGCLESEVSRLMVLDTCHVDLIQYQRPYSGSPLISQLSDISVSSTVIGRTGRLIQSLLCVCSVIISQRRWTRSTHTWRYSHKHFRGIYTYCARDNSFVIHYCWERLKSYWGK